MDELATQATIDSLNVHQLNFVQALLADPRMNSAEAYIKAYDCDRGEARHGAGRLMKNIHVKALIRQEMERRAVRAGVTIDALIVELSTIAFRNAELMEIKGSDKIAAIKELSKLLGFNLEEKPSSVAGADNVTYVFQLHPDPEPKNVIEHRELIEESEQEKAERELKELLGGDFDDS